MNETKKKYKESVKDINNPTLDELKEWMFAGVETINFDTNADGWALFHALKILLNDKEY